MSKEDWIWMPHAAHFIGANYCRFHMSTKVGKVIVSTVGEYFPDHEVREIFAKTRGIMLKGKGDEREYDYMRKIGYEDIGCDRKYETMVFYADPAEHICCPWRVRVTGGELDLLGYNDPGDAYLGHMELCRKWDK